MIVVKERNLWILFVSILLVGQYFSFLKYQHSIHDDSKSIESIPAIFDDSESLEDKDESYHQGYTDGYHKATEQFNCPAPNVHHNQ